VSGATYHETVREFLESQGWRVTTTEVQEGVTVLAGAQDGQGGSSRMLTMVVEDPVSRVSSDHLEFLLKAGEKKGADRLALTATADVPGAVRDACEQREIELLGADTVRSAAGGQGLGAGVDDISMPGPEQPRGQAHQPSEQSRQSPQQPAADAGRNDAGAGTHGQQPAQQSKGGSQPPSPQSTAQSPPPAESPEQQPPPQPGAGETNRRRFLLGGAGVAALAAGGWYVFLRDDDPGGLEGTAQAFVTAVDNGNRERVNELIADEGEMDSWSAEDRSYAAENSYEMTDFAVVERDGDVAKVDITMRVSDGQVTETTTVRYELHRIDGEWKFWNVLGQPDDDIQQTTAEETGEQSTDQVAGNVDVVGKTGEINSAGTGVAMVRLTVQLSPGSPDVDLRDLSVQYVGDNGVETYEYAGTGATNAFHVVAITAESPNDPVLTEEADRYEILIPFDDPNTDDPTVEDVNGNTTVRVAAVTADLATGGSAEFELTTGDGATRNVSVQVPDSLPEGGATVTL
jgi:flagellin FlaB